MDKAEESLGPSTGSPRPLECRKNRSASAFAVFLSLRVRPAGEVLLHVVQAEIEVSAGNNEVVAPAHYHIAKLIVQLPVSRPRLSEPHLAL